MNILSFFLFVSLSCHAVNTPPPIDDFPSYAQHAKGLSGVSPSDKRDEFRKIFEEFWTDLKISSSKEELPYVEAILMPALTKPMNRTELLIASIMAAYFLTPQDKRDLLFNQYEPDHTISLLSSSSIDLLQSYQIGDEALDSRFSHDNKCVMTASFLCAHLIPLPYRKIFTRDQFFRAASGGFFLFSVVPPEEKAIFHGGIFQTPLDQVLHDMVHCISNIALNVNEEVLQPLPLHEIPSEFSYKTFLEDVSQNSDLVERHKNLKDVSFCFLSAIKSPFLDDMDKIYLRTIFFEILHERGFLYFSEYRKDFSKLQMLEIALKKYKQAIMKDKRHVQGVKNEMEYYKKFCAFVLGSEGKANVLPQQITILKISEKLSSQYELIGEVNRSDDGIGGEKKISYFNILFSGMVEYKRFKKFYRDNAWSLIKDGILNISDVSDNAVKLGIDYDLYQVFEKYLEMARWVEMELQPEGKLYPFFLNENGDVPPEDKAQEGWLF